MKHRIFYSLCFMMTVLLVCSVGAAENVKIGTADELLSLMNNPDLWSSDIVLTANINMADAQSDLPQAPIGTKENAFNGSFDGGEHTVNGIFLDIDAERVGFFGSISNGAVVKNLTVSGSVKGSQYTGGLIGYSANGVTVENCVNNCTVDGGGYSGGIIGFMNTSSTYTIKVIDCINNATVDAGNYAGGIVGHASINVSCVVTVKGCQNSGDVTSSSGRVGGILGSGAFGSEKLAVSITNCTNTGDITGGSTGTAGIIGYANMGSAANMGTLTVSTCKNSGDVTSTQDVGGIAGYITFGKALADCVNITKCQNDGEITATSKYSGGIIGLHFYTNVSNCLNNGKVNDTGSGIAGGISARINGGNAKKTLTNCYNSNSSTGMGTVGTVTSSGDTNFTVSGAFFADSSLTDAYGEVYSTEKFEILNSGKAWVDTENPRLAVFEETPTSVEIAKVKSPDESVVATISFSSLGEVLYTVEKDGKAVLESGKVGLTTTTADYSSGLVLAGIATKTLNETVSMTSGSYKQILNHANELTVNFENGYSVIFRAYNDGVAFRQALSGEGNVKITEDCSVISIPALSNVWAMATANTSNAYSAAYTNALVENMSGMYYFPTMYNTTDGVWCLLTEADMFASGFAGSVISANGDNSFSLVYAAYQNGGAVSLTAPCQTPWRTVICGTLATMVENTMVDALTEKTDGDYSYVETGVSAWSWLNDGTPRQDDVELLKRYIDLAHEMKWEYFILDEGWQPHAEDYTYDTRTYDGFYDWLPEIMEYANERDVKLIAWLNRRAVDTASEVVFLEDIKKAGFAGIKVDFFDSESSTIVVYYNRILEKCRELGLVVNIHGTNKPTGERMTYPNIIAKEAVYGDEAMKTKAKYTTLIPFTRGSLGSTDFTPAVYPFSNSDTTIGHQAALATLIECGMLTMASSPSAYYNSPFYYFYYDLPTHWDDIHFIDGYPEQYTVLARKSGETWYVAGITTDARTITVDTDFLASGNYNVAIYGDNADGSNGVVEYKTVTAGDIIAVDLIVNGGAVLKIVPADNISSELGFASTQTLLAVGEEQIAPLTKSNTVCPDVIWTTSDDSVVTVKNGHMVGIANGNATVTATSAFDGEIKAELSVRVLGGNNIADDWTVKNKAKNFGERAVLDAINPYKLTMTTSIGYIGVAEENEPANMWMIDAPEGDFSVTVKTSGILTHSYNSCLVGVYADGSSVIQMARRFHPTLGNNANAPASKLGTVGNVFDFYTYTTKYVEKYTADTNFDKPAWLRITREGDVFYGYYSYDGINFTEMSGTLSHDGVSNAESLKIVIASQMGGNSAFNNEIVFEDFTLNGVKIPFTAVNELARGEAFLYDALLAIKAAVNNSYVYALDINHDNEITLLDVIRVLKSVVR